MKVIDNDGEFKDRYDRYPIRFQKAKSFQKVYDWLYSHYPDHKFAVIFDCTEVYLDLDELFVYFLGDVAEEAASECGMKCIYPILGRIPPLLSEAKVGDECRLLFLLKLLTISKIYAIIDA